MSLSPLPPLPPPLWLFSGIPIWIKRSSCYVPLVFVHWKKIKSEVSCQSVELGNINSSCQKVKSCLTCYIYHFLIPDTEYVSLRHKNKFWNLTLADFRYCKMYVKPLVYLRHITRLAETHAPPSPCNRTKFKETLNLCERNSACRFLTGWVSVSVIDWGWGL